jgi:hypothetical protein
MRRLVGKVFGKVSGIIQKRVLTAGEGVIA